MRLMLLIVLLFSCGESNPSGHSGECKVNCDPPQQQERQEEKPPTEQRPVVSKVCQVYNHFVDSGVPAEPLRHLLFYRNTNPDDVIDTRYIAFADYSQNSSQKRFYLLDMQDITYEQFRVSHGSGKLLGVNHGDPEHDGELNKCIHDKEDYQRARKHSRYAMTRPGFFMMTYQYLSGGSHLERRDPRTGILIRGWPYITKDLKKNAVKMVGLNKGINDRAYANGVVMHGAWYNEPENTGTLIMGRSFGCPAFAPEETEYILNKLSRGSLFYSYTPQCGPDFTKIKNSLAGSETFCQ